ncbi:MAG: hypothetical protein ACRDYC_08480 [Acidimicrobiales bacterium]
MLTGPGRRGRRDESGIVGTNLVVTILFAVVAVIFLSAITLDAEGIDNHVKKVIRPAVGQINTKLDLLPILNTTDKLAAEILVAAQPLTGQVQSILNSTNSINSVVSQIEANVLNIHGVVGTITASVDGIGGSVAGIHSSVVSIGNTFVALNPVVTTIQQGVVGINNKADVIITAVRSINGDVGNILSDVTSINGHAKAIDCGPVTGIGSTNCNEP